MTGEYTDLLSLLCEIGSRKHPRRDEVGGDVGLLAALREDLSFRTGSSLGSWLPFAGEKEFADHKTDNAKSKPR